MQNTAKNKALGFCLGASTISAVELTNDGSKTTITNKVLLTHEGNPRDAFEKVIKQLEVVDTPIIVTGRKFRNYVNLPSITEPEAIEHALEFVNKGQKQYNSLVSAGGETFIVYRLDKNQKVVDISTGNKCASGTGEFFLQQIRRMDLNVTEAIAVASKGTPYPVSGRCSVFCKSDCTHALNKGETIANVTSGLCKMIAQKVVELLAKFPNKKTIVVGGVAQNKVVINFLKKEIPEIDVPEEAPYFEALGAALTAFDKGTPLPKNLFSEEHSHFSFLPPLKDAEKLVTFRTVDIGTANKGDKCIIGLDVGSTTTKAVLLRADDNKVLGSIYLRTNGNPVEATRACYKSLLEQLKGTNVNIVGIGVTGSGRQIAGLYSLTDGIINEIIAHATAAIYYDPEVDTIFEIGGQDAKYTYITNSVASDYAMNEACSAGTGSFLEESAYESLNIKVEDIADYALKADAPPNFNDQCAAFISSDIKNASHENISTENIVGGLVYSICLNYVNRVKGHRQVGKKVFMQGGVCYNKAVPLAMASILQKPIIVPPDPGLMGAFGVALEIKKRIELGLFSESSFNLESMIQRQINYDEPFVCNGGKEKCDIKCSINRIRIDGKIYPFGGSCNKYTNLRQNKDFDEANTDYVNVRTDLMFDKYAPVKEIKEDALTIGVNRTFVTHWLFPLYYNFFTSLGCKVITSHEVNEEAFNRQFTSLCFPAQLALGLFDTLIEKDPDYYFMPHVEELHVPNAPNRKEFSSTCIFVQGEAFWLRRAFMEKDLDNKILAPTINFVGGWEKGRDAFVGVAKEIGFSQKEASLAFDTGLKMQHGYEKEYREIGRKVLADLHANPEKTATVLFGRPYNSFTDEANKGIPKKITSRGHIVIPFDMLDYDNEPLGDDYNEYMHWELGHKILRASQIVKRDEQLFGVYITNFLCAIDSFLVTYFRNIMQTKPSLTLELDGHTADAGVNTRIEAFYDIVANYLEIQQTIKDKEVDKTFKQAKILIETKGIYYLDSKDEKMKLTDPRVKLIIPSMTDLGNRGLAAVCEGLGIRSEALNVSNAETLQLGRGVTTCKECLPMILCVGSMLQYIKHRKDPDEKLVVFQPRAAGYCRMGQYHSFMNMLIRERKLKDIALIALSNEERYAGLGTAFALNAWKATLISDVMDDIRGAIWTLAKDVDPAIELFNKEYQKILDIFLKKSKTSLYKQLEETAAKLKTIELKQKYEDTPEIVIMGEIFVRKDAFSNMSIAKKIAARGFLPKVSPVSEWIWYLNYMIKNGLQKPEYDTIMGWIEFFISDLTQKHIEKKIKKILAKSGLYELEMIDVDSMIEHSKHLLPKELKGEPGMIIGVMMKDALSKYAGIVNIGPFGCMPVRFIESIMLPLADVKNKKETYKKLKRENDFLQFEDGDRIPFLTIEADGNPYPQLLEARFESFCLQSERIGVKQNKKTPPNH
jgi:predicted CoA-substrate-specific enzyme activase